MPSDSSSWCLITKNRTAATLMARNCSLTHHWKRVSKQLHKSIPRTAPKLSGAFGKSDPLTSWDQVGVWLLAFPNFCTLSSCSKLGREIHHHKPDTWCWRFSSDS
jgi:hypothetical protein